MKGRHPRRALLSSDVDRLSPEQLLWYSDPSCPSSDRADVVRHAVESALSDKQREVVEAFFFEGLSEGDIARRLGITQQVVHKRIHGVRRNGRDIGGAIRRLREVLAPVGE